MFLRDGIVVTSASDLSLASACAYAFSRKLDEKLGRIEALDVERDPMLVRASQLGDVHEATTLQRARAVGGLADLLARPRRASAADAGGGGRAERVPDVAGGGVTGPTGFRHTPALVPSRPARSMLRPWTAPTPTPTMNHSMTVSARFTRDEYLALPESPPGVRFELLDGELVTMNDPLPVHQIAVARLLARLMAWCEAVPGRGQVLLPVDTEVGDATIFGPDLQWFAPGRALPSVTERPWPAGDLVVEVASPSTARYDAEVKADRYLRAGTREVWLVGLDPLGARVLRAASTNADVDDDEGVVAEKLGRTDALCSPLLDGFAAPLAALVA